MGADVGRRGPGGAQFDLGARSVGGHLAETFGVHHSDGAAQCMERGLVRFERVGEPTPSDARQRRIGRHLGFDVCAGERHAAECAVPRVVAGRIVQQDESAGADVVAVARQDVAADGMSTWCDPLGCWNVVGHDFRTQDSSGELLHGLGEVEPLHLIAHTHRLDRRAIRPSVWADVPEIGDPAESALTSA